MNYVVKLIKWLQSLIAGNPVRTAGLVEAAMVALAVRFGFNHDSAVGYAAVAAPIIVNEVAHWTVSPVNWPSITSMLEEIKNLIGKIPPPTSPTPIIMANPGVNTSSGTTSFTHVSVHSDDALERALTWKGDKRGYGYIPDVPDMRDHRVPKASARQVAKLPAKIDLHTDPRMPAVWDQGQLGSCTAHGIGAALVFHDVTPEMPSRLFIYYNERAMEGSVRSDSGAQIRDGIKSVVKQGVCAEDDFPYDITKFAIKPSAKCYTDALANTALAYQRVTQDVDQIRTQLAAGNIVVIGFSVYESFESDAVAKSGRVGLPKKGEALLGGHCVALVGYDNRAKRFIARNSWGTSWGQSGYFTLPYSYVTNPGLASDFWTISSVGSAA